VFDTSPTLTAAALGGTTNLTGGQIAFPATQNPSSNANTLDDYEEGTFTPTVVGTTSAGAGGYDFNEGYYTRIGNVVTYQLSVAWTSHSGTGNMVITGLPFAGGFAGAACCIAAQDVTLAANSYIAGAIPNGDVRIVITNRPIGGGAATAVAMDTSGQIIASGTYIV
jgi:hypothetical protein